MTKFNPKKCFWITTPSSDFEKDRGVYKEDVVRVEKDSNPKYSAKYCIVRFIDNSVIRAKGSPEEVAKNFWKSRALPDGEGGYYKKITPRKDRN